ncbi:unnamed protein product [Adineta ricciae]|uniref:Uncharacterized protein n=1 Tax=Adineta ricciae TaxID=249248 RepID=A0A814FX95_ADIRI|nr:unnamed protein product [Adineta ricciae]CAF1529058.1 unnamed protein product [Adineta ricciae]
MSVQCFNEEKHSVLQNTHDHSAAVNSLVCEGKLTTFKQARAITPDTIGCHTMITTQKTILRQILRLAKCIESRCYNLLLKYAFTCYPPESFQCDGENENDYHLIFHDTCEINKQHKNLCKYASYLYRISAVMKCTVLVGSIVDLPSNITFPQTDKTAATTSKSVKTELDEMWNKQQKAASRQTLWYSMKSSKYFKCFQLRHCNRIRSENRIEYARSRFERLGGEIEHGVVFVRGRNGNALLKMLYVFIEEFLIHTISLKNVKITKDSLVQLLNFISHEDNIIKLELDDVSVKDYFRCVKTRDIISMLNHAVETNDKLTVQYVITKSFTKVQEHLFDIVVHTNSRLIFQIQLEKQTPSVELFGTHQHGFVISINKHNTMNNIVSSAKITQILQQWNVSEFQLHNAVLSEDLKDIQSRFLAIGKPFQLIFY